MTRSPARHRQRAWRAGPAAHALTSREDRPAPRAAARTGAILLAAFGLILAIASGAIR